MAFACGLGEGGEGVGDYVKKIKDVIPSFSSGGSSKSRVFIYF